VHCIVQFSLLVLAVFFQLKLYILIPFLSCLHDSRIFHSFSVYLCSCSGGVIKVGLLWNKWYLRSSYYIIACLSYHIYFWICYSLQDGSTHIIVLFDSLMVLTILFLKQWSNCSPWITNLLVYWTFFGYLLLHLLSTICWSCVYYVFSHVALKPRLQGYYSYYR
jgi:hypothetical protein